jgi:hypothetical protein
MRSSIILDRCFTMCAGAGSKRAAARSEAGVGAERAVVYT